jgi:integrase/recombinase XerC/integrase/recombinase XerD
MDRRSVHRYVARTAQAAAIGRPIGPQRLLRHTRPETTLASYDISGDALERHASPQVAGFLAGWTG